MLTFQKFNSFHAENINEQKNFIYLDHKIFPKMGICRCSESLELKLDLFYDNLIA